jgi:hypothetical protein
MSCYKFGIHLDDIHTIVDEAHEICVPQNVLEELSRIRVKGKEREARDIMLQILQRYSILPLEGDVDRSLVFFAQNNTCIVCTNDRNLRKKIRALGQRVVFVRSRSHLVLE